MFKIDEGSFSERELKVLNFWQNQEIFQKSVKNREKAPLFSFYDGPPFATGLPHYGHILAGTIKDVVLRYQTMKGFHVPRRFGWDCHGLPVENEIEKAKELSGAPSIEAFGIANFNEECRSIVLRYTEQWKETVNRMGRWVDFDRTYRTMDPSFMESVWWVFSQLWEKGLVYEGYKVMPFSAKLGTPLSNFEANLNYRDVDDPSLTVTMPLRSGEASLLVWTTTPWTLPSNLALIVNPKITYAKVRDPKSDQSYILAHSRVKAVLPEGEVLETFPGEALRGLHYVPPFDYFKDAPKAFAIIFDEAVSEEDGTGVVHAAPAFGEMDFFACQNHGIEPVCPVDQNGKFTSEVPDYAGQFVKDADKAIMRALKERGRVFHQATVRHRYPFCWRSDSPLIYKAVSTWFVAVEKIKGNLLEANEKIRWVPDHVKHGRFGKWLEGARDWAISRNRYWGTPIPLWRSDDGTCIVISSVEDLERRTGQKVTDLHRHFIDELTFEEGGKLFKRVPEVFDCWFESGSMPYGQNHYPFERHDETVKAFPADFIAEGLDQTRGWFYTLTILSTALFNQPAFKNVIVNGIILAEDGAKMSKRLKNYPEPSIVFDKYGADAVRLYLLNSPAVHGDDLRFSERGVELVLRQFLIPFWNAYSFLATYANIYQWEPAKESGILPKADIDRWILSRLQRLVEKVTDGMTHYQLSDAVTPFVQFIEDLTNWYIRRCRPRFWSEEDTLDRREAFETLYTALHNLSRIAAPFIPFLSDAVYKELRREDEPESVHLTEFPVYSSDLRDEHLEHQMELVQRAASLGHSLRKENKMKVRQPLSKVYLITAKQDEREALEGMIALVCDELNVKEAEILDDENRFVEFSMRPNFATLGRKAGAKLALLKGMIAGFKQKEREALLAGESLAFNLDGEPFELMPEDVLIDRKVKEGIAALCEGSLTVALDLTLSEALLQEGMAREIVNKINTMRRSENFEVVDRIHVVMQTSEKVQEAFRAYESYISGEVLAVSVAFKECSGTEWDLNGENALISISKA